MEQLVRFLPIIIFIAAYFWRGIYFATGALIVSQFLEITLLRLMKRRVETMSVVVLVLSVLLGGSTLLFHKPYFIQLKPTLVYWLSAVFFVWKHYTGRTIPEVLLGKSLDFTVSQNVWRKMSWSWIALFASLGVANLLVLYYFSVKTWFYFKLYGVTLILFIFMIIQVAYLFKNKQSEL